MGGVNIDAEGDADDLLGVGSGEINRDCSGM